MKEKKSALGYKYSIAIFFITMFFTMSFAVVLHFYLSKAQESYSIPYYEKQVSFLRLFIEKIEDVTKKRSQIEEVFNLFNSITQKELIYNKFIAWDENGNPIYHSDVEIQNLIKKTQKSNDAQFKDIADLSSFFIEHKNVIDKESIYVKNDIVEMYFPFSYHQKKYYMYMQNILPKSMKNQKTIISFYLVAIIVSLLVFLVSLISNGSIKQSIMRLVTASDEYLNNGKKKIIKIKEGNEIDFLAENINQLIMNAPDGFDSNKDALAENNLKDGQMSSQNNEKVIDYLQKKLFEKPFIKMNNLEAALYPKNPDLSAADFFTAYSGNGYCDFMLGRFEDKSIESNIWKHRIQELFFAMSKEFIEKEKIVHAILEELNYNKNFNPSTVLGRLDIQTNKLNIYKAGLFYIYEYSSENTIRSINTGIDNFSSENTKLETIDLSEKGRLILVSNEVLENINMNSEKFEKVILNQLNTNGAKNILKEILKNIYDNANEELKKRHLPGLIAVLSEK
ncbi:MAG: hypothetical protein OEZ22_08600 [Spirochaetia bacterium]|nr:hypothetical protein [Spirochaetia bacterium]